MFFCFAGIFYHLLLHFGKNRPQILLVTVSPEIWKNYMICYFSKLKRELFCNLVFECSDFWIRVGFLASGTQKNGADKPHRSGIFIAFHSVLLDPQNRIRSSMYLRTSHSFTRSCCMVSRSRMVTLWVSSVSKSTQMLKGVPISSCRR